MCRVRILKLFIKAYVLSSEASKWGDFSMANPRLRLVAPATENRTVTPRRPKNSELRTREYLTADEVERLIEVAKTNRHGHRDANWPPPPTNPALRAGISYAYSSIVTDGPGEQPGNGRRTDLAWLDLPDCSGSGAKIGKRPAFSSRSLPMVVEHLPLSYGRWGSFALADVLRTAGDAKESLAPLPLVMRVLSSHPPFAMCRNGQGAHHQHRGLSRSRRERLTGVSGIEAVFRAHLGDDRKILAAGHQTDDG